MDASSFFEQEQDGYDFDDHGDGGSPLLRVLAEAADYAVKKKEAVRIDYSVLSVGVMTLGLIMIVEVIRHKLDHAAHHRPFYKAVLEGVYEELATLGIVEFFLHLLAEYYEEYDKAKKQVFADVHFLLFYTAIFQALQSLLLNFVTSRISKKIWVQTETLEIYHYVEIREEFERTKKELDKVHRRTGKIKQGPSEPEQFSSTEEGNEAGTPQTANSLRVDETAEEAFHLNQDCVTSAIQSITDRVRYPALKKKYNSLLLQVRFHELRVHFLQAYDLPLKFKVSDYLVRSEQAVLVKLIHVSSLAWLLLTGVVNLLYYILGIVSYKVGDAKLVGVVMIYLFFVAITVFVFLSWLVSNKMKAVFKAIMNSETLWDVHEADSTERDKLAAEQKALFWGSDPKLVIATIQFMQFGYAVVLSTVIIFWEEMNDHTLNMGVYLVAIFLCYSVFVSIVGYVIPRYTLCTSLAQLVNLKRLHESVAVFKLEEAKVKELEQADNREHQGTFLIEEDSVRSANSSIKPDSKQGGSVSGSKQGGSVSGSKQGGSVSGSSTKMDSSIGGGSSVTSGRRNDIPAIVSRSDSSAAQLMELVKLDTDSLRTKISQSDKLRLAEGPRRKKNRLKQFSDGVSAMNRMKAIASASSRDDFELSTQSSAAGTEDPHGQQRASERPGNRTERRKARSEGVDFMAGADGLFQATGSVKESVASGTADLPATGSAKESVAESIARDEEDDNASLGSQSSGYSDVNDVPEVSVVRMPNQAVKHEPKISVRERLHNYFMSRKFIVVSNVFGTMIAFFFVGQRVESFLHSEGIADDRFTHFDFAHGYIFWLLTCWLLMFVVKSCLVFYALEPFRQTPKTVKERHRLVAAISDFVLCQGCIALLFVAEAKRCCDPTGTDDTSELVDDYDSDAKITPPPCSCPAFGSRQYGGLGPIEPYISLIALRLFRHWVAKRIVKYLDSLGVWSKPDSLAMERAQSLRMNPFEVFASNGEHKPGDNHQEHEASHGHGEETGTAAELWESAIGRYPEVAGEYGEFSAEMLRAMLGLKVETRATHVEAAETQIVSNPKSLKKPESFSVERQYSELDPAAQEVIMAGKLGRSVVRSKQLSANSLDFKETATRPSSARKNRKVIFKVDENAPQNSDSLFLAPNARLVRSMRRCDRKLLPMIDHWTVVDVAITHFEMVYFDASDADDVSSDTAAEGSRQALIATKGGRNLRLCDVSTGRRIVGHQPLSEISSLYVERLLACKDRVVEEADVEVAKTEFWKHSSGRSYPGDRTRGEEWSLIKQDVLTVHTIHGHTLYLRFYADLEDAEHHPARLAEEDEAEGFLFKNNAFHWVQTIGRFCGPDQLKQELPNFGEGSSEELRDFLIVTGAQHSSPSKGQQRSASREPRKKNIFKDRLEIWC